MLPVEIWHTIMLSCPQNYCALALVCRSFRINTAAAKIHFTSIRIGGKSIRYQLPCKWRHRTDGPASTWSDGSQFWFIDDKLHRDDDLPAAMVVCKRLLWYKHGRLHRENGPAVIWVDGTREWWIDGVRQQD